MNQPDLSVAIIFKNESRCLERCLKSLQPLRERLSLQIVMADTGSTDGSREIAARYADVLIDFPWINDFAAARNATLEHCTGRWTLVIDCEYPAELSTMFAAFGPPRHTVYLPVPFLCSEFPAELTSGKFCDAVFARFKANRELLPQDKLAEFERTLNRRHDAAVEKARAILKKGGSKAEAGKILSEAFLQNWEDVRKLSEGK